jgi:hypothetical protein
VRLKFLQRAVERDERPDRLAHYVFFAVSENPRKSRVDPLDFDLSSTIPAPVSPDQSGKRIDQAPDPLLCAATFLALLHGLRMRHFIPNVHIYFSVAERFGFGLSSK